MLGKKLSTIGVLYILILLAFVPRAYGAQTPNFPSCVNPQGTVKVSYDNGTHGVPGDSKNYSGKDTVYTLSDKALMQCLCPTNGSGIQTNWWKAEDLSQEEIQVLTSQGWIYIADGSAWGLDNVPYLAKNHNFACHPSSSNGGGNNNDNNNSGASSSNGTGGTSIPTVLGLANTGNMPFILSIAALGIAFIASGLFMNKKQK